MTLQTIKNQCIFGLVRGLSSFMQALPLSWARALGSALGRLFYVLVGFERRKVQRNIEIAFPEWSQRERLRLASATFAHVGRAGVEFLRFPKIDAKTLDSMVCRVEGLDTFTTLMAEGKGVVAVTGHMGNWELMAAWIGTRGFKTGVVAQKLYDPRFDEALNQYRRDKGIEIFPRNTPVRPILRFLKAGGALGVLADQDTNVDSVWVPFFGRLAKTPIGPVSLAQASGAALVTLFNWREPDGRYAIRFGSPIPVPERGQDVTPAVAEYARLTEEALRAHPEQWVWMHERWRSKPPQG